LVVYGPDGSPAEEVAAGTVAFVSLAAASAVGAGAVLVGGACRANHVLVVSGSSTAGAVELEGSLDQTTWYSLGSVNVASDAAPLFVANSPAQFLRANVTTAITGGSITATVGSA
jgi:hypothetical protein